MAVHLNGPPGRFGGFFGRKRRGEALAAMAMLLLSGAWSTANAVINNTTYPVTTVDTQSLLSMTGSTQILGPGNDDTSVGAQPIGFDFVFDGVRYNNFTTNANGFIRLGNTIGTGTTPWDNTWTGTFLYYPVIGPYQDDHVLSFNPNAKIHYRLDTSGGVGARKLIVEWVNVFQPYSTNAGNQGTGRFQAVLSEGSGKIEYYYTGFAATYNSTGMSGAAGYTVGFASSSTSMVTLDVSNTAFATTPNQLITTTNPPDNRHIVFTPLAVSDVTGATATGLGSAILPSISLSWTNSGGAQVGTMIYRSDDDGLTYRYVATAGAGVTTYSIDRVGDASSYKFKLVAIGDGAAAPGVVVDNSASLTPAGTRSGTVNIFAGASGTFPDFPTLTAAFADIATNGLSGNLNISLQAGYTPASETFPIALPKLAGRNAKITIQPAAGTTHTITTALNGNGTFRFDDSRWITIDGDDPGTGGIQRSLTITNSHPTAAATSNCSAALFINDASFNTLQNLTLTSANPTAAVAANIVGTVVFAGTTAGTSTIGNDGNTIDNCVINGGGAAASLVVASNTGTNLDQYNSENRIINSDLRDYFTAAVATRGIIILQGNTGWTIQNNNFFQSAARTFTTAAIHSSINIQQDPSSTTIPAGNGFVVDNNRVGAAGGGSIATNTFGGTVGTTFYPISVRASGSNSLTNNTVAGMSVATSSAATTAIGAFSGISLTGTTGASAGGFWTVSGNTVGSTSAAGNITVTSTGTTPGVYGITVGTIYGASVTGNTVAGISGVSSNAAGAPVVAGINLPAISATGVGIDVNSNIVGAAAGPILATTTGATTGSPAARGIWILQNGAIRVGSNTVRNVSVAAGTGNPGAASLVQGIVQGSTSTAGFLVATGNTVRDLTNPAPNITTGNGAAVTGISLNTTATQGGSTISGNTIFALAANGSPAATQGSEAIGINIGTLTTAPTAPAITSETLVERNLVHSFTTTSTSTGTFAPRMVGINTSAGLLFAVHNNMVRLGVDSTGASLTDGDLYIAGIRDGASRAAKFYHNSVYIGGTGVNAADSDQSTFCFLRSTTPTTTPTDLKNNIFQNARSNNAAGGGSHYIMGFGTSTTVAMATDVSTNGNVYFFDSPAPTGSVFATRLSSITPPTVGTSYPAFSDWVTAFPTFDGTSSTNNPQFVAPAAATPDLHINPSVGTPAEQGGLLAATTVLDFDGQTRSGLTPVDIGADAGNFVVQDLSGPAYAYTALGNTQSTTNRTLSVTITDLTGVDISAGGGPRFYYRNSTTNTPPGSYVVEAATTATPTFTVDYSLIGGTPAVGDVIQYYIAAQDTAAPTASTSPAGGSGLTPPGSTPPGSPASYSILAQPLNGIYDIGTTGTYANLTAAAADFNVRGVSGPVTLRLLDATYAGDTYPITFQTPTVGPTTTATNTVTIKPGTGVTAAIAGNPTTNTVLRLLGVSYFTVDGSNTTGGTTRDLTIQNNEATNTGSALRIQSLSLAQPITNVAIRNTNIVGSPTTTTFSGIFRITDDDNATAAAGSNIDISNNAISRGFQELVIIGNNPASFSNVTIANNVCNASGVNQAILGFIVSGLQNSSISGNTIGNVNVNVATGLVGISVGAGSNNVAVSGNTISSFTAGASVTGLSGISMASGASNISVSGNTIRQFASAAPFNPAGILAQAGSSALTIERNLVSEISYTGTAGLGPKGIDIVSGAGSNVIIRNNMISRITGDGDAYNSVSTLLFNPMGIRLTGTTTGAKLYNNSIYLDGNTLNFDANATSFGVVLDTGSTAELRNNIIVNNEGRLGATGRGAVGLYLVTSASQLLASSNNIYSVNPSGTLVEAVGQIATGTPATTVAAWQTTLGGGSAEANSFIADPLFTDTTNPGFDLHLASCQSPAIGAGSDLIASGITGDFDGATGANARPAVDLPEIGADETAERGTPAASATAFGSTPTCSTVPASFTPPSNAPDGYLVIRSASPAAVASPTNFTTYTAGAAYGSDLVAAVSSSPSFIDSSVTTDSTYYYTVFSLNGGSGCERYRTADSLTGNSTTPSATLIGSGATGGGLFCPGSPVTLTVSATGSGTLSYDWRRNGFSVSGPAYTGLGTASLGITGLTAAEAGSFDVIVTGDCGAPTSAATVVTLNSAPTIGSYAGNLFIGLGATDTSSPSAAPADVNSDISTVVVSPTTLPGGGTVSVNTSTGEVTVTTTVGTTTGTVPVTVTVTDSCGQTAGSGFNVIVQSTVPEWQLLND